MMNALSVLVLLAVAGCDLDDSLFNQKRLSSYTLRTDVIPESQREFVELQSQGRRIYGYFVRSWGIYRDITILYCHGNRDHLEYYWDRVELLYRMGFNVFVFDYQGFGMSEGEPSETALYSDGTAALEYVRGRPIVGTHAIVLYGFSLGNSVATHLAANVFTPLVLINESGFASAKALVQSGTLLDIPSSYVMKGEYNNLEKIRKVHAPYLILHGENDPFIDIDKNAVELFRTANEPKEFDRIAGAGHSDIPAVMGEEQYIDRIREFILKYR